MGATVVVMELDDGAATLSITHDGVESVLHFLYNRQIFPIGGGEYAVSPSERKEACR